MISPELPGFNPRRTRRPSGFRDETVQPGDGEYAPPGGMAFLCSFRRCASGCCPVLPARPVGPATPGRAGCGSGGGCGSRLRLLRLLPVLPARPVGPATPGRVGCGSGGFCCPAPGLRFRLPFSGVRLPGSRLPVCCPASGLCLRYGKRRRVFPPPASGPVFTLPGN